MADADAARVVLLARAGEARDHLEAALAEAGADVVLVADPATADPQAIAATRPQAVLVALEPAIEDALERFDEVFADPSITVIFDEAELAARRTGWDAARWGRHLVAKLHRHDDVLPPGSETESDWQPVPGALPRGRDGAALDLAPFADEAQTLAFDVPRDDGLEVGVVLAPSIGEDLALADFEAAESPDTAHGSGRTNTDGATDAAQADDADSDAAPVSFGGLQLVDSDELFATLSDEGARAPGRAVFDGGDDIDDLDQAVSLSPATEAGPSALSLHDDGEGADAPAFAADDADLEAALRDLEVSAGVQDDASTPAAAEPTHAIADRLAGSLSLVDDDADNVAAAPLAASASSSNDAADTLGGSRFTRDLDALDQRVSSLSLAETDSYGHGPARGVVWIEGGLGAPDAVRQLLGALPESFPRPVIVRLHLDGGRYDRLVKQMGRASTLAVALAEAGQSAAAGTVHFVTPTQSLQSQGAGFVFVETGDAGDRFAALPANDSAVVFLSGSDAAQAQAVTTHMGDRGLLAAQTPDSCYDATASTALLALGAESGTPAELAARLVARWPA